MNSPFPTLDALRPSIPKAEPSTDWVAMLAATPAESRPASGWKPPKVETVNAPAVDLEAVKAAAQEEGFCKGYLEGQRAGTERGLAEGRRVGRDEGRESARREVFEAEAAFVAAFQEALAGVVAEVGPAVERWKAAVEERAAALAMNAVRALLAQELATDRPDAMNIVREALGHAEGALKATIRLAPFDRAALAERREEILSACASLRDVELVDDRSIEGGCVVETESGVVDATLATRLSLLEAA